MSSPVSYDLQGQGGGVVLSAGGVSSVSGDFRWIQVVSDTVLEVLVSTNISSVADLTETTLPAGLGIGGRFSSITLTTGLVIAYYA